MESVLAVCHCETQPARWCTLLRRGRLPYRLVGEAADGETAVRLLAARQPDLILVDLPSFGEEAQELCRHLSAAAEAAGTSVPVIALAPRLDDPQRVRLLDAGVSGYVLSTIDDESMKISLQAIADIVGDGTSANGGPPTAESRLGSLAT